MGGNGVGGGRVGVGFRMLLLKVVVFLLLGAQLVRGGEKEGEVGAIVHFTILRRVSLLV